MPEHEGPRRQDRSRDEAWIRDVLARGPVCVLGFVQDGRPFALPRLYAFDAERNASYLHGAHGGVVGALLEAAPAEGATVALTVFEMGRILPAPEAGEFSLEYASVMAWGTATEVTDAAEAQHGLRLLMEKYAPHMKEGVDYSGATDEEIARTSVVRVDIQRWSGKERGPDAGAADAYRYEEARARVREQAGSIPPPGPAPPRR